MRGSIVRLGFVLVALAGLSACSSDDERAPGLSDCEGVLCGTAGGGSGGTPEAGTEADAQDAAEDAELTVVNLSGNVVRYVDQDFSEEDPYTGWGYLRVPTPSQDEEFPFGGDAGPGYAATGVLSGDGWFTVVPDASLLDAGAFGAMLTYAYLHVPEESSTSFSIPIVERSVLASIYTGFTQPTTVRADAAQVIVIFEQNGQRVSGVGVTAHPSAEALAFNTGVAYVTEATETGLNGVLLLVNVTGTGPLKWQQEDGTGHSLTIVHVPGQASLVRVEVPE